jgi:hypothetical protein
LYDRLEAEEVVVTCFKTILAFVLKLEGKLGISWGLSMLMRSSGFLTSQTDVWSVSVIATCLWVA